MAHNGIQAPVFVSKSKLYKDLSFDWEGGGVERSAPTGGRDIF